MTVKEFLQRTRKLGRLAEVSQKLSEKLIMPRHYKKLQLSTRRCENLRQEGLSCDAELIDAIFRAQTDALEMASSLGMKLKDTCNNIPNVPLKLLCLVPKTDKKNSRSTGQIEDVDDADDFLQSDNEEENENQELQEEDNEEEEQMPPDVAEDILLGEETTDELIQEVSPSGRYLKYTVNGKTTVMLRSSIIWGLTSRKFNISPCY